MKKTLILLFFFVFIETYQRAAAEQVNVAYGGFSFGSNLPTNTVTARIQKTLFIDNNLREAAKQIQNKSFQLFFDPEKINQIKREDAENQIVILLVLDDESFFNTSFETVVPKIIYSSDIYLTFRIIFFNSYNNTLVASLPFIIKNNQISASPITEEFKLQVVSEMYKNAFQEYVEILNNFILKKKYNLRIGIKNINISPEALSSIPDIVKKDLFFKNKFASFLDSQISKNNNVSTVPFGADRTVSTIEFTYQNQQIKIKYPDPDFYIDLDIKKFVRFEDKENITASNSIYYYGSSVNFKVYQPEINKVIIDSYMRRVLTQNIPKDIQNLESFEWVYFKNSLNALFNKISMQTNKLDSEWIKDATESNGNVKKDFEELKNVYNKCR
jgi:hypothetical protein